MIDNAFRSWFGPRGIRLAQICVRLKLTPNLLTCISFLLAIIAASFVALDRPLMGLVMWWFSRFFDAMDGVVARFAKLTSPLGAFMDLTLDMMSYSLMILALGILHPHLTLGWGAILILYIGCVTSALSLGTIQVLEPDFKSDGRGLTLAAGLAEGGETGIMYSLMLLFPGVIQELIGLWIIILVTTIVARFLQVKSIQDKRVKR